MGRYLEGNDMPWSSTDTNIKTAKSTLDGDPTRQVSRDSYDWVDNFGRYFVEKHGDRYFLMRDYWPSNDMAPCYPVNYDWQPTAKDKAATDWKRYHVS